MTRRVVLVGDTHLPRFGRTLPAPLVAGLATADTVLHAGDITDAFVLDVLAEHAPDAEVKAVAGNNDPPALVDRLGHARVVELEGVRIGLTHGHLGRGRTTPERAVSVFATADPPVHAVAFGHSHIPLVERRDGVWLLNPGSPTDRRRQASFSYLELTITRGALVPRLVTWSPPTR